MSTAILTPAGARLVRRCGMTVAVLVIAAIAASVILATENPAAGSNRQSVARSESAALDKQNMRQQAASPALPEPATSLPSAAGEGPATVLLAGPGAVRNEAARYSLWAPVDWQPTPFSGDQGNNYVLAPGSQERGTRFWVVVRDTGAMVTVADLPALSRNFSARLAVLPDSEIEWQARYFRGASTIFEAKHTYHDLDTVVTRWLRLIYEGRREYVVLAESDNYAAWAADFVTMMTTFSLHEWQEDQDAVARRDGP